MKRTVAVEVDIIGIGEVVCIWRSRHDQDGLYLALKFAAVTALSP